MRLMYVRTTKTSKKVLAEIGRLVNTSTSFSLIQPLYNLRILAVHTVQHKSQYLEAMQIRPRDLSSSQRARETETIGDLFSTLDLIPPSFTIFFSLFH